MIGDCQIVRRYPTHPSGVPPDDDDAAIHMGTLLLPLAPLRTQGHLEGRQKP